ncbi:suppressor of fused homolog [Folsomia candida]|uniref:suppressor of fused homolog n=1 Tax=Folsomia candida TaxID=158441 RepID=UPI000B9040CA|nr:suppressor of fused homolog [Folsomia candida]
MERCGSPTPWGLEEELHELPACHKSYHASLLHRFQQVNQHCDLSIREPVTFNSVNKIRFGGQDVLDYVVCYATRGNPVENVPDHWHYVSFGLSDIHGHDAMQDNPLPVTSGSRVSGLGFELTFRLEAKLEAVGDPPAWPVDLLQKLARYIHVTPDCIIVPGDHITWHAPLHGNLDVDCEINHMLVAQDVSIPKLETPTGCVAFHQVVGVTYSEVQLAQRWNATSLMNLFREQDDLGGSALVTDIFRKKAILELHPNLEGSITFGIQKDGSDLNGVGGRALWTQNARFYCHESHWWALSEFERRQYILFESSSPSSITTSKHQKEHMRKSLTQNDIEQISNLLENARLVEDEKNDDTNQHDLPPQIKERIIFPNKVHLTMSPETGRLLPLALRGRVDHNRHFTIKDTTMEDVITFVPNGMSGSFTTDSCPFAACGPWLHIQLDEVARKNISEDVEFLFSSEAVNPEFPKFLAWPEANLALTILDIRD